MTANSKKSLIAWDPLSIFYEEFKNKPGGLAAIFLVAAVLSTAAGCSKAKGNQQPVSAPEVEVVKVEQKDVSLYSEWIGTLDGMVNAEIKSQMSGYLLSKHYEEGSFVKKGQLLFQIDPKPFQAALDQAKGDLAKAEGQLAQASGQLAQANAQLLTAEANQGKTQQDVDRYTSLVERGVITKQVFDNAVQTNLAAQAQIKVANAGIQTAKAAISSARATVDASKSAVDRARLNLDFTRITSPIDGIAGIAKAQVGNLVGPAGEALTTVSTVDPIKVYFTLSEQEYLNSNKHSLAQNLELEMVLADGATYPHKGRFFVADREVDAKTGTIRLAGVFPNPGNALRPGQYARLRAVTSRQESALIIPQRAVTELQGSYQVAVVGPDNRVEIRPVRLGERVGPMVIINEGLKAGESVIAEGAQKVKAGTTVSSKPFTGISTATQ
ncbi:MAG TPA: efflux RND transporter periplasmic adaptor subunit [Blastocatellia bacterium]|nr:efflux RND transporter periplasmic adaptor subunit [Blastocatellia bacterium]